MFVWRAVACLLTLAGSLHSAQAATPTNGPVSGIWTKTGSPYIATGDITIPPGQTLTIQPGVTIIIGQGLKVTVNGTLVANGTAAERITIRGANPALYWDTIAVNYGVGASTFSHCILSEATNALYLRADARAYGGGVAMVTPILNCVFTNCQSSCIYGVSHGYAGSMGAGDAVLKPTIVNCRFDSSSNGCVFFVEGEYYYTIGVVRGAANPLIANCIFGSITGSAVGFSTGSYPGTSYPQTFNDVFMQCTVAVQKTDPESVFNDQVGYNCFYNNQTNFVGYPPGIYGTICCINPNGTPCDLLNNIFVNPLLAETINYTLSANSPCIDAGNPASAYLDSCLPPSQGTTVNDMGVYGGPNACGWLTNQPTTFSLTAQQYVGVTINPSAAGRYRLEYVDSLVSPPATNGPWIQATNLLLLSTPFTYIDFSSPGRDKRFYRAALLP
jgi:hypothetical protein